MPSRLYLRDQGVRIKPLVPDIVSFARQLDLRNRWIDPANRHWGIQKISVMNYWVTRDLSAEHWLASSLASDVLLGATGVVTGHPFPIPGDHLPVLPHPCLPVTDTVGQPPTATRLGLYRASLCNPRHVGEMTSATHLIIFAVFKYRVL
jgi:hypothetical protein